MPVSTENPSYKLYKPVWQKTRDAVKGAVAVKDKKHEYLPVPDNDSHDERKGTETVRYRQYLRRAVYTNFTGRTKNAFIGAVFRKSPIIELPEALEYLRYDATGDGLGFEQLAKDELSNLLETGRAGFLVDYPSTEDDLSAEQVALLDLKASIIPYTAEQIINWQTTNINGRKLLSLVVLAETYCESENEFEHEFETQYRVLRLTKEGYSQQLYREDEEYSPPVFPTKSNGERWYEIPFVFVGSKNNDSTIDDAPISDIAELNIAHYRNSADYEESCFLTGQPTLFITHSMSKEQWDSYNPNGIKLGSRSGHVLGESGSASLVQASPNGIVKEAMIDKENAMVAIGARIITDRGSNETAEGARIRFASENSVLGDIVNNLSSGLTTCIQWVSEFMGADGEISFKLNTEFYDKSVDPQLIMSMLTLLDRDLISEKDVFVRLQSGGIIDANRTLEEIKSDRGLANPLV